MKYNDIFSATNQPVRHILNVSGGKDSSALAILLAGKVKGLEEFYNPDIEYVFCDTQKELPETYDYLARLEIELGKKVIRLNDKAGFDHWWKVNGGYLPSPQNRWCTQMLKLKPFEKYVGDDQVVSYVGLRADEDRTGYISKKPNIKAVFPLRDAGINLEGVKKILGDAGMGLPTFMNWGRTNSGCTFCFFQQPMEWVRLYETYPHYFYEAMKYEQWDDNDPNKQFTWIQGTPLKELIKPEKMADIKKRHAERQEWLKTRRKNKKLIETVGGLEIEEENQKACLICQL